jgi:glucosamine 6-phosphate synthetase-like amidotransferase/phosphosugar isomerase protein
MCGIAGVFLLPASRPAAQWQRIRHLFTQTLLFNEERGRQAAGVASVRRDGTLHLFKQPVAAAQLVAHGRYRALLAALDRESVCLLGHTRWPTKGSRWNNANNHPLRAGHTVGVHNGIITNDDELFEAHGLDRRAQVDSEVIFRLLDSVDPHTDGGHYAERLVERVAQLEGTAATLSVDVRRPQTLVVLKRGRPLCLHYAADLRALFFSSRYLFLRKAFGHAVVAEMLEADRLHLFEADALSQRGSRPVLSWPLA